MFISGSYMLYSSPTAYPGAGTVTPLQPASGYATSSAGYVHHHHNHLHRTVHSPGSPSFSSYGPPSPSTTPPALSGGIQQMPDRRIATPPSPAASTSTSSSDSRFRHAEVGSPPAVKRAGFSVSDILDGGGSGKSVRACSTSPPVPSPIQHHPGILRPQPLMSLAASFSMAGAGHHLLIGHQHHPGQSLVAATSSFSRDLKFGVERILSNDMAPRKDYSPCNFCSTPPPPISHQQSHPAHPQQQQHQQHHVINPGPCECSHPLCDGTGIYPLYAYPTAAALSHAVPYPSCAMYPTSHLGASLSEMHHPVGFHHGHPHHQTSSVSSSKRKRSWSRAVFSNLQRKGLEKRFLIQKYITKPDRRQLAATLGLTDAQVKVWFQNRRMKWRHSKEAKEELAKQNKTDDVKEKNSNFNNSSSSGNGNISTNNIINNSIANNRANNNSSSINVAATKQNCNVGNKSNNTATKGSAESLNSTSLMENGVSKQQHSGVAESRLNVAENLSIGAGSAKITTTGSTQSFPGTSNTTKIAAGVTRQQQITS